MFHDSLYYWVRGFQHWGCFFEMLNIFLIFRVNKIFYLVFKNLFFEQFFEHMSTYFNNEYLHLKNTEFDIKASGNSAKKGEYVKHFSMEHV